MMRALSWKSFLAQVGLRMLMSMMCFLVCLLRAHQLIRMIDNISVLLILSRTRIGQVVMCERGGGGRGGGLYGLLTGH